MTSQADANYQSPLSRDEHVEPEGGGGLKEGGHKRSDAGEEVEGSFTDDEKANG